MHENAIRLPMLEIDLEEGEYKPADKKPEEVLYDLNLLRREIDRYRNAYYTLRDASYALCEEHIQQKVKAVKQLIHPRVGDVKEKDAEILALYNQLTKHGVTPPPDIPKSVEILRDLVNSAYRMLKFSERDNFQEDPGYKWEMGRLLVHTTRYTACLNRVPSLNEATPLDREDHGTRNDQLRNS